MLKGDFFMKTKIYRKDGRKYVKSKNGEEYSYYTVLVTAIAVLLISLLLMAAGIVAIFSEPVAEDYGTFSIVMTVKTIVGLALCYGASRTMKVFDNIMKRF